MSTSSRPYLLRAIYEWLLDNNLTPHIVIATDMPGVEVPSSQTEQGQLVLNISPDACRDLIMGNQEVTFGTRFSGTPRQIRSPLNAIMAIYARENGQGMVFGQEPQLEGLEPSSAEVPEADLTKASDTKSTKQSSSKKVSHLRIVK
ncbi:ClpXP protease specificity-enhancing factor [Marinospirillum insulare]|uniref:Stringent starvation protein B n=1 Tax=Marinospirillum insulare TaxID=217169 RepID=A0ABQ5ZXU2_9GAMM|nr:ClpXP protease specificity-enhancing factor [Marinospirillum insulare]GLR63157.1 stringent starvation protein B [Marinospirillum insulare]